MPKARKKKTSSALCASINKDLNILQRISSSSDKFLKNAKKILNSFDKETFKIKDFSEESSEEISSEEKNKLLQLFTNSSNSNEPIKKPIKEKLIKDVIGWVLKNTGGYEESENDWKFGNNIQIIKNLLYREITPTRGLNNCYERVEQLQATFEHRNKKEETKDETEQKTYQLVLANLCLFILDKKNKFIDFAQKKATQEKAVQEKAAQEKAAQENKFTLSDPKSNSKNTSNSSSAHSQKKENKNLPLEAEKGLLPVSYQETMKKEVSDQIAHQKDNSFTTQLPNSGQSSLPSIQPTDSETSIEDNPINLDQHKKEKNKVVEFTLYYPGTKNKTADSCLNGQKNLDSQDITRHQFEIETSLPYKNLKEISTILKNKRKRLKEKLLTLGKSPSDKALLNSKKSPLHLAVSTGLTIQGSTEDKQTQIDQNNEKEIKVVEVIIDFSQKEKIDDPALVQLRKSIYKNIAKSRSSIAIKESTTYKTLEKEIRDLTSELQNLSHQNTQKETNNQIYEEALKNAILKNQLKQEEYSENISSEISAKPLIKNQSEAISQQTHENSFQEGQIKEVSQITQPENKSNSIEEKLNHYEEIINNALAIQGGYENKLSQLENSILTLERKMVAEKDKAAYSTKSAKIEGEINQEDKADTEKFNVPFFEEDKLITESQTISHQNTKKEIVIKSSKVSVDQPETKRIDLQNIKEEGSQNLQKDNSIFPIEQVTNNNPENINVNIEEPVNKIV